MTYTITEARERVGEFVALQICEESSTHLAYDGLAELIESDEINATAYIPGRRDDIHLHWADYGKTWAAGPLEGETCNAST